MRRYVARSTPLHLLGRQARVRSTQLGQGEACEITPSGTGVNGGRTGWREYVCVCVWTHSQPHMHRHHSCSLGGESPEGRSTLLRVSSEQLLGERTPRQPPTGSPLQGSPLQGSLMTKDHVAGWYKTQLCTHYFYNS